MGHCLPIRSSGCTGRCTRLVSPHGSLAFRSLTSSSASLSRSSTCGNMLSAVALQAVALPILPYTTLFTRARSLPRPKPGQPLLFPLSILSASNGAVMRARVPIDPVTLQVWQPLEGEGVKIAGVPGEDVGIELEMPMAEDVELFEPASTISYEGLEV